METESSGPGAGEVMLYVISGGCLAFLVWKVSIDGFYTSELPLILVAGLVTAVFGFAASRVTARRKRSAAADADRSRGVG